MYKMLAYSLGNLKSRPKIVHILGH